MKRYGVKKYVPERALKFINQSAFKDKDSVYFICDMVLRRRAVFKDANEDYDCYIDIPRSYFRSVIKKHSTFKKAYEFLTESGIIEVDGVYKKGSKCLGYRIGNNFISVPQEVYITKRCIVENIAQMARKFSAANFLKNNRAYFKANFRIDCERASNWSNQWLFDQLTVLEPSSNYLDDIDSLLCATHFFQSQDWRELLEEYRMNHRTAFLKVMSKYIHYYYSIKMIQEEDLYYNRNSTNNRIDTNLTSLKSELRQFIVGAEELVQIDLVNSQPMFLYFLMTAKGFNDDEVDQYGNYVLNGTFYEDFATRLFGTYNDLARKSIKKTMFTVLFSKNHTKTKAKALFQSVFPRIFEWIAEYKQDDHTKLAVDLQRLESSICIDDVCKKLFKNGIEYYTIHDSWIVRLCDKKQALEAIEKSFIERFGRCPSYTINPLQPLQ